MGVQAYIKKSDLLIRGIFISEETEVFPEEDGYPELRVTTVSFMVDGIQYHMLATNDGIELYIDFNDWGSCKEKYKPLFEKLGIVWLEF